MATSVDQGKLIIRKAAVLGAGVMGAQIAAHLANADIPTLLFELPAKEGDVNRDAIKAIEGLGKLDPKPLAVPERARYIQPANYRDHLAMLRECDFVIEAIAERMEWKIDLYQKIAPHLGPDAILATNTSGLSIAKLASGCPQDLKKRFCGVHFFNPPRYMHLVELILTQEFDTTIADKLEAFLVTTLGKGVIRAKDTPNFLANRVGVFSIIAVMHYAEKYKLSFDVVDALTGPAIGRPKSATFRTADVVGLDVLSHVIETMHNTLGDDPWHGYFKTPTWLRQLIEKGTLGQKSKCGIYRKNEGKIEVLDPMTMTYGPASKKIDSSVQGILNVTNYPEKCAALRSSTHPEAQFLWAVLRDMSHYCAYHLADIADNARDLDLALRWGFGWRRGPFESGQTAGWRAVAQAAADDIANRKAMVSVPFPTWVLEPDRTGVHEENGSYSPSEKALKPRSKLAVYDRQLFPDSLVGERVCFGETIFESDSARLWHSGDGIAILGFKSKMHVIGDEVLDALQKAVDLAEAQFKALVIWQRRAPFSAGANLLQVMQSVQTPQNGNGLLSKLHRTGQRLKFTLAGGGGLSQIMQAATGSGPKVEEIIARFQQANMRLKYSKIPTVAAVHGLALGGGCEIILHCDRTVATLESYIGLVEAGVGLLPAGGGCKEIALRAAAETKNGNVFAALQNYFQPVAMAQVSSSAEHAGQLGFLRPADPIVMNEFELLFVAKSQAQALADIGYRAPLPATHIPVAGAPGIANIKLLLTNMLEGEYISEHDYLIASRIAYVMCGGEVEAGSVVDEQWLLDLERDAFCELLATEKTQARIEHTLKTGKPLRN